MHSFLSVPLTGLTWIVGFIFVLFAAHYFLSVLESTANGGDTVEYSREPMLDWAGKAIFLVAMGCVWGLIPAVAHSITGFLPEFLRVAFAATLFAMIFPFGLLSSLSSTSVWTPFSVDVARRLAQRPVALQHFALFGIPAFILVVASFQTIISGDFVFVLLIVLAPATAVGVLLYGRSLGLLGLVLSFTKAKKVKKKKKGNKAKPTNPVNPPIPEVGMVQPQQPSQLPALETPFEGPLSGYDVKFEDGPPKLVVPILPTPTSENIARMDAISAIPIAQVETEPTEPERVKRLEEEEDDEEGDIEVVTEVENSALVSPTAPTQATLDKETSLQAKTKRIEPEKLFTLQRMFGFLTEGQTILVFLRLTAFLGFLGLLRYGIVEFSKDA